VSGNEFILSAPAWGAALPGAQAQPWQQWLTVEPSSGSHVRTYALASLGYVAGAMSGAGALGCSNALGTGVVVAAKAGPKAAASGRPTDNLNQQFTQMKTRVNVDRAGARGPEPEREQA
jgi:hypothetical protein